MSSNVNERVRFEIYYPPFQAALDEGVLHDPSPSPSCPALPCPPLKLAHMHQLRTLPQPTHQHIHNCPPLPFSAVVPIGSFKMALPHYPYAFLKKKAAILFHRFYCCFPLVLAGAFSDVLVQSHQRRVLMREPRDHGRSQDPHGIPGMGAL